MFDRLKNLLGAAVNKSVKDLETPEVLAERAQEEFEGTLKALESALVESVTREKLLEKQLQKAREEVPTWEKRAAMAVAQNNDDIARQALQKKAEFQSQITDATSQLEQQKLASADIKSKRLEIQSQYSAFKAKKDTMIARAKAGEAQAKAQTLTTGGPGGMDKWEEKINEREAKSQAMAELSSDKRLDASFPLSDVDLELAQLKEQMTAPKLIVDTSSDDETK